MRRLLTLLCVAVSVVSSQDQDFTLAQAVPAASFPLNGAIDVNDIGEGFTGSNPSPVGNGALNCHTDDTTCCRGVDNPNGGGRGEWYYPDGTVVPALSLTDTSSDWFRTRNDMLIRLNRRRSTMPTGVYRCSIPTMAGSVNKSIGIYDTATVTLCPNLELSNGEVTYDVATIPGKMATHTCDTGYTLSGSPTRTCSSPGGWSGTELTCVSDTGTNCPSLSDPDNGQVTTTGLTPTSTATYSCDFEYEISGDMTRTCGVDGMWTLNEPTCDQTCSVLPPITNGLFITYSPLSRVIGSEATYTCMSGYQLTGQSTRTCGAGDMWSGTEPSCIAICDDLTPLNNGMISYNPSTSPRLEGAMATYSCDNGFQLSGGNTMRTCGGDRQWSGTAPTCVSDDCPSLTINNGMVEYSSTVSPRPIGSTATVSCNLGYHLVGGSVRTCRDNGWDEMNPTCTRTCSDLPSLTNGMITYNPSTSPRLEGATATHSCNNGFQASSSSLTRTCTSSGTWSDVDITCSAICPDLSPLTNGMITYDPSTSPRLDGAMATYSCNNGFQLSGSNTVRTCGDNGEWSGTAPMCDLIVSCGSPPSVSNGSRGTPTSTTFGGTVTYMCDNGFILTGSATVTCLSTGSWSTRPMCQTPPPVYLSLSSTNYLTNNSEILISSIGEIDDQSLVCHTDLTTCCRGIDVSPNGMGTGEWVFPSGTNVVAKSSITDSTTNIFFRTRHTSLIRLLRRGTVTMPTGSYCCMIPTNGVDMTICANLVETLTVTTTEQTTTSETSSTTDSQISPGTVSPNTGPDPGAVAAAVILVMLLVVAIIVGVIVGVYLWRRLHQNRIKYTPTGGRSAPPPRPAPYTASFRQANGEGKATIEKVIEPSIIDFPSDIRATEGEEVYLRVKVGGHPPPSFTWYHNGIEVTADYATELGDDGGITFPCIETKHDGVYKLVVSGPSGAKDEKQLSLSVGGEGVDTGDGGLDYSPVSVAQFGAFVADFHANGNRKFKDYYKAMDSGERDHPVTISITPENRVSNRFGNIAVYDDNLIVLQPLSGQEDCQSDYINACYVDGYKKPHKFLATQGPLPRTLVDFWRLMWQERPTTIVMLTNLKEGNKIKCQPYWPESGKKRFGPFTVTITDQQVFADYTIRTLEASLSGDRRSLKVKLFHFTAWPDHGVPDYATPVLAFHRRVKSHHNPSKGPLLIHCSAGVGRTGTYIAIDNVLDQIAAEGMVDISGVIVKSRNQRMKLVQTQDQYVFIHDAILESVTCGDTQISAGDLRREIQKMSQISSGKTITGFQDQFKVLEQVSPNPSEVKSAAALKNAGKNRGMDYLPSEGNRVILKGEQPDYIHAVFVHGYKHQKAYIIAQNPLPSTIRNFWKVIYDRKCAAVVMLTPLKEEKQEVCSQYWPESGLATFGEFTIDNLGEEAFPGFTIRSLSVLNETTQKAHQVTQFHVMNWTRDGNCANLKTVTDVNEEVTKVQRRTGNKPILVHCTDTVTRSGMYCAIATTIDRCKTEGVVDVFQVVKALRVHKPGAVMSVENYQALFDAVLIFLDSFDNYANFQDI